MNDERSLEELHGAAINASHAALSFSEQLRDSESRAGIDYGRPLAIEETVICAALSALDPAQLRLVRALAWYAIPTPNSEEHHGHVTELHLHIHRFQDSSSADVVVKELEHIAATHFALAGIRPLSDDDTPFGYRVEMPLAVAYVAKHGCLDQSSSDTEERPH